MSQSALISIALGNRFSFAFITFLLQNPAQSPVMNFVHGNPAVPRYRLGAGYEIGSNVV